MPEFHETPEALARIGRLRRKVREMLLMDAQKHRDPGGNVVLCAIGAAMRDLLLLIPPDRREEGAAVIRFYIDNELTAEERRFQEEMHGRPN
jgi:hypothetical protein